MMMVISIGMSNLKILLTSIFVVVSAVLSEIKISRVGNGPGSIATPYLLDSYDLFSNPGSQDFCSGKQSFCRDSFCRECQCNYHLSFYSFEKGCVSYNELNKKPAFPTSSSTGQGCEFSFYYFKKNTIPVWKTVITFDMNSARIGNGNTISPPSINLNDFNIKCAALELYMIGGNGSTLIEKNQNQRYFEIQNTIYQRNGEIIYVKSLKMNTLSNNLHQQMAGHLIKLVIKCNDNLNINAASSCILFKMNGTYTGKTSMTRTTKRSLTISTNPQNSTTKKTQFPKTTATAPDATVAGFNTKKNKSVPIGAIVGGIIALIVVLVAVGVLCFYFRRKKNRRMKRPSSPTKEEMLTKDNNLNGNDISYSPNGAIPSFSLNQHPRDSENIEMREATNPYYTPSDDQTQQKLSNSSENLYYRPADLSIKPNSKETGGVYYSSADVVDESVKGKNGRKDNTAAEGKAKRPQEYSYARTDSPCSPVKDQNSHYKALESSHCEPGMYQSLENPVGKQPHTDPSNQEQLNPYYKPARPGKPMPMQNLEPSSTDPGSERYLSLKNNAGSRENVGTEYQVPDVGNTESHYQGLTMQNQSPPQYAPLQGEGDEEYQDMSGTPDEYTYVTPGEQTI